MENSLRLQVIFGALDRLTAPMRGMAATGKQLSQGMRDARAEIKKLEQTGSAIGSFRALKLQVAKTREEMQKTEARATQLGKAIATSEHPTRTMRKEFDIARRSAAQLRDQYEKQSGALGRARAGLRDAGVDTAKLASHQRDLAQRIEAANRRLIDQKARLEQQARAAERAERVKNFGGKMATVGGAASLSLTTPMVAFAVSAVRAARDANAAMAQTEASLASMGAVAKRTLPQLQAEAADLMASSLYDDDEILRKVTANLLTFGKVSGTTFDRAQQAVVNLSAKLGQDLQSSTIQIAKALNDPVKGVTALAKVGVSFTADQKAMIKSMVAAGNVAGAQSIILAELERQYGKSAKAARDADPGAAMAISFGEFQQAVGDRLLPKLTPVVEKLTQLLDAFGNLPPGMQQFLVWMAVAVAAIGPLLIAGGALVTAVGAIAGAAAAAGVGLAPLLAIVAAVVAVVGGAAWLIWKNWDVLKARFLAFAEPIRANLTAKLAPLGEKLRGLFDKFGVAAGRAGQALRTFADSPAGKFLIRLAQIFMTYIGGTIINIITTLVDAWSAAFTVIGGTIDLISALLTGDFGAAWQAVKDIFSGAGEMIMAILGGVGRQMGLIGSTILDGLGAGWDAAYAFLKSAWDMVSGLFLAGQTAVFNTLAGFWTSISTTFLAGQSAVFGVISAFWTSLKAKFWAGIEAVKAAIGGLPAWLSALGGQMMAGLVNALDPSALAGRLLTIARSGINVFKNFFGIKSPSRLFMDMGKHITDGLAAGIDRGGRAPLKAIGKLATGVAVAGAIALPAVTAPAMPAPLQQIETATPTVPRGATFRQLARTASSLPAVAPAGQLAEAIRPGSIRLAAQIPPMIRVDRAAAPSAAQVMAAAQPRAQRAAQAREGDRYEIHIHQQPGEDAQALADRVMRLIDTRKRRRALSSFTDDY